MNWWIITYLVLYCGLLFFSLWDNVKRKEPLWYVVLDALSDASAITLITAFWFMSMSDNYGALWLVLFLFSLCWVIATTPHEIKKNDVDSEFKDNKAATLFGFAVMILLSGPAYIWGGLLSWKYLQNFI